MLSQQASRKTLYEKAIEVSLGLGRATLKDDLRACNRGLRSSRKNLRDHRKALELNTLKLASLKQTRSSKAKRAEVIRINSYMRTSAYWVGECEKKIKERRERIKNLEQRTKNPVLKANPKQIVNLKRICKGITQKIDVKGDSIIVYYKRIIVNHNWCNKYKRYYYTRCVGNLINNVDYDMGYVVMEIRRCKENTCHFTHFASQHGIKFAHPHIDLRYPCSMCLGDFTAPLVFLRDGNLGALIGSMYSYLQNWNCEDFVISGKDLDHLIVLPELTKHKEKVMRLTQVNKEKCSTCNCEDCCC